MLISVSQVNRELAQSGVSLVSRNALIGLASGTLFGMAAVAYASGLASRAGWAEFHDAGWPPTLFFHDPPQTFVMLVWMLWRDPLELRRIAVAWKPSLFTGFVGASASFGWFAAMTLQQAAIVKALAQIEMIFAFASTVFFFRETDQSDRGRGLPADRGRHRGARRLRLASGCIAGGNRKRGGALGLRQMTVHRRFE